ncbi:MAG: hypothetical protein LUG18_04975 [Candidatus Azobacteroides sp.]|nr:hypothetical protein [Candidatus Azobacteroides sp.]
MKAKVTHLLLIKPHPFGEAKGTPLLRGENGRILNPQEVRKTIFRVGKHNGMINPVMGRNRWGNVM